MNFLQKAVRCVLLLHGASEAVQSREIEGQASPGNFILREEYTAGLSSYGTTISISSNVPVTVQRYYDDVYLEGEQPLLPNEAKVLVTSDCAATTYVPQITWGASKEGAGSIEINVQGALGGADMPFLESSFYHAVWDYTSSRCERSTYPPKPTPAEYKPVNGRKVFSLRSALPSSIMTLLQNVMGTKARKEDKSRDLLSLSEVCTVNVEVMLDGCSHSIDVTAPNVRVIDAKLENASSQQNDRNECVWDYYADIMFSGSPTLEGTQSLQAPSLEDEGFYACYRAVPGRPFVDSTKRTLQASPLIVPPVVGEAKVWSADEDDTQLVESRTSTNNSTVNQNQLILGEEWTKSALGEHASVASFSAFSIALMTNQAPSDLVEDALKAALDEVRHAKTSFDIASKLTGKDVGPGPLPESKHVFSQDMKALALAVAKEGCVDETLSAFEAAAEADLIDTVLANGADGTKYSDIDKDILVWIRDELHTIALEESNHAALAWRTFKWVCSVDADACSIVKQHVLNENELERAFQRRFGSFNGRYETLKIMEDNWRKIYSHIDFPAQVYTNIGFDGVNINSESLVSVMAGKVVQGVSCM